MSEGRRPAAGGGQRRGAGRGDEDATAPGGAGSPVDRADYDPRFDPKAPVLCEVCGGEMYYTAACKLKCPRCGYMRDCSDP